MKKARYIGGIHSVRAALAHGPERVEIIYYDLKRNDRRLGHLLSRARKLGLEPQPCTKTELERLLGDRQHQGIVARVRVPGAQNESTLEALLESLEEPPFLLVLDGVQDPHNLGACLRSAEAAGVHAVITPRDRAAGLTPVACKVASGAAETLPFIQVTNLARTLERLRKHYGILVLGLAGEAEASLYQTHLHGGIAVVMGSEEKGLRRLTRTQCDRLLAIPLAGHVESLNVSAATAVVLFEAKRQRDAKNRALD